MTDSIETPILPVTDEPKIKFWTRPVNFVKKHARPIAATVAAVAATAAAATYVSKKGQRAIDVVADDEPTVILPRYDEEVETDA